MAKLALSMEVPVYCCTAVYYSVVFFYPDHCDVYDVQILKPYFALWAYYFLCNHGKVYWLVFSDFYFSVIFCQPLGGLNYLWKNRCQVGSGRE